MVKVEILTDTTVTGLHRQINDWVSNGWRLHERIVVIDREEIKRNWGSGMDQPITHYQACGFLQVLTRTEGTCRDLHIPNDNA